VHGNAVAVHHFAHLLAGEKHRRRAVIRHQLTVAVAVRADRPHREPGKLFAQTVLAAPVEHHLARAHQRIEQLLGLGCARRSERGLELLEAQWSPRASQHGEHRVRAWQAGARRGRATWSGIPATALFSAFFHVFPTGISAASIR
jgi:hypothetical protein